MCVMQLVWSLILSLTVRSWAIVLYFIVVSDIDKHLYVSICHCLSFLFVAVLKHWPKPTWGRRDLICRLLSTFKGAKAEVEVETTEQGYFLVYFFRLASFSYSPCHLPRDGTAPHTQWARSSSRITSNQEDVHRQAHRPI